MSKTGMEYAIAPAEVSANAHSHVRALLGDLQRREVLLPTTNADIEYGRWCERVDQQSKKSRDEASAKIMQRGGQ